MKKLYFLVVVLCVFNGLNAQIVDIPDANFKAKLLAASSTSNGIAKDLAGNYITIDSNGNGEIESDEALQVGELYVSGSLIADLTGIKSFINLRILFCYNNQLTNLDVSNLNYLLVIFGYNNSITTINAQNCFKLTQFDCSNNNLNILDLSGTSIMSLVCGNNPNLSYINIKNGIVCTIPKVAPHQAPPSLPFYFGSLPKLASVCCDLGEEEAVQRSSISVSTSITTYCSFTSGGTFFTIQGNNKFDNDNNGCDALDIVTPNLKFTISDGVTIGSSISNSTGNYSIPVQAGTHTITPILENPTYFDVSPTTVSVTFPSQTSPFVQDYCITANGVHPDLEISLLPIRPAVPGFDAIYKIVYKNKGNQTQSGSVNLTFDDAVLDLVVANPAITTQTTNNLSWDFTNLLPFETREITFTLNVNSPLETPAVNSGSVLVYNATITSAATDETPLDNTFTFNQTLVNSFDPNDKTCLEGTTISPDLIGQYVHYMIRFENNGTANAQNIVVKDMIDLSKFDISTLVPTSASHSFVTNISAGNKVEFIFENINLPFDDANNDGYIAFKIKTLPTLVVNDTFTNDASIYFDYNFPVVTKLASSTFKTLATPDFEFANYFTLYPNPAKSVLNISSKEAIEVKSISIYNALGQLVLVIPNAGKVSKIDVSSLTTGNYFIKINSDRGTSNARFVKE